MTSQNTGRFSVARPVAGLAGASPPAAAAAPRQDDPPAPAAHGRARSAAQHIAAMAGFMAAGVALTWPRAAYLAGRLPATRDAAGYVWGFWWTAHQLVHLGNPWVTGYQAAPVGAQLGFHTLMPLPGLLMTPVTLAFGPSASYNLLSAACPGLLAYAMCRAARLWLPNRLGAVAAGCFFGFSPEMCWVSWYQLNLAAGAVFLPLALEASVRLRRACGGRQAAILGAVLAAAVLTDQESAVMTAALTALCLLEWLLSPAADWRRYRLAGMAVAVSVMLASPQLLAMAKQMASGNAGPRPSVVVHFYNPSGTGLVQMFAPSPRLAHFGLSSLTWLFYQGRPAAVLVGYGTVLSVLGCAGLVAAWRRRSARLLALLWAGGSALALGSAPWILNHDYHPLAVRLYGVPLSGIMPYTWLVQLPGMSGFREADRFTELGLVAAALLAGAAVTWLADHARPLLFIALACGLLELGWSGSLRTVRTPPGAMPTAIPALDGPIAADHSHSIVVDVPFGIRGGLPVTGGAFPPETLVLATADSHPLADAYVSRIPAATLRGIQRHPFYAGLFRSQGGPRRSTPSQLAAARRDARQMNVGWVIDWAPSDKAVLRYLRLTGFRFAYRADGASVYRRIPGWAGAPSAGHGRRAVAGPPSAPRPLGSERGHRPIGPLPRGEA